VCFDEFPASAINHVGCHHSFCEVCWKGYLENAVSEGPSVLSLRCPHDKCTALVTEELARRFMGRQVTRAPPSPQKNTPLWGRTPLFATSFCNYQNMVQLMTAGVARVANRVTPPGSECQHTLN
jgi:hypothetical protein